MHSMLKTFSSSSEGFQDNFLKYYKNILRDRPQIFRSSRPEVFLGKDALKIYSKFSGDSPCRSVISIKLLCNPEVFLGKAVLKICNALQLD